tara:strand:- start:32583 stop:33053 length:471 start_codon:yes stop_codon:yes gene_type:complete
MKELLNVVLRMSRHSLIFALFFMTQLLSCKTSFADEFQNSNSFKVENILNENFSGYNEEEYILIKNQEALNTFYGRVNRTRKPGIIPPEIDFTKNMLLVWCGDDQMSNFVELEIRENNNNLIIHKLNSKTKKKHQLVVNPFSIFKLPLSSKSILIQ